MADRPARSTTSTPLLVAAVTLAVTGFTWNISNLRTQMRETERFQHLTEQAHRQFTDRIDRQVDLLLATRGFVLAKPNFTREDFRRFVEGIDLEQTYPGATGVGWSVFLRPGQEQAIVRSARSEGIEDFHLWGEDPSTQKHAILYLEPLSQRNRRALGFNMFSNPTRRIAMERARDSGRVAASGRVRLVQETETNVQPGFLLYLPVYDVIETPASVELRRKHLIGFVYSPFRAKDLLSNVFGPKPDPDMVVEVYDGSPTSNSLLFKNQEVSAQFRSIHRQEDRIDVAGQTWFLVYRSTAFFEASTSRNTLPWIVAIGLVVAAILTGLTWRQAQSTNQLARQTRALEQSAFYQRLLAESGSLLNQSLDYQKTLQAVARLAVPEFADWCAVDLIDDGGKIQRLATQHVNPEKVKWAIELQEKWPPDATAKTGVPNVIRTGESELYETIPQELLEAAATDDEQRKVIQEINFSSAMIVPIRAREKIFGALTFVWAESGHHYNRDDLRLAEQIAERAGMAIDNALLYNETRRERSEVQRLNRDLERRVEERTAELITSNHELEAFAYSVSHDLRAPLRSIDGFSRSLLDDYGDILDDTARDYLGRIRAGAKRMDELISALLSLSRITRSEMVRKQVDVTAMAEQAAAEAKAAFGTQVQVVVQPGLTVEADDRMLRAVFDNLISNAVKFSSRSAEPLVQVGFENGAYFVRDNGVGFNPEYKSKLFAPFERLHSSKDFVGSGIGLATVQRIIHRHGGKIWAESEEGKGATFYFTLA